MALPVLKNQFPYPVAMRTGELAATVEYHGDSAVQIAWYEAILANGSGGYTLSACIDTHGHIDATVIEEGLMSYNEVLVKLFEFEATLENAAGPLAIFSAEKQLRDRTYFGLHTPYLPQFVKPISEQALDAMYRAIGPQFNRISRYILRTSFYEERVHNKPNRFYYRARQSETDGLWSIERIRRTPNPNDPVTATDVEPEVLERHVLSKMAFYETRIFETARAEPKRYRVESLANAIKNADYFGNEIKNIATGILGRSGLRELPRKFTRGNRKPAIR